MHTKDVKAGITVLCSWNEPGWFNKVCTITKPVLNDEGQIKGWYVQRCGRNDVYDWFELSDFGRWFELYDEDYAFFAAVGPGECVCKIPKKECKYHR